MMIKAKIGARIKELRMGKGFTQEEVAWKAEIDRTFMNHVENSRKNLSIETLEKIICYGLDTSFKEFFDSDLFNVKSKQ
jgi:transcriptional regulator with XRE-family HTH domain